ncbi:phosphotransferase [Methylopila turkensis]|uniref:Choline kinase n=1 Tax=Methylopila turkensis TaxID=1437816 RepID=A0A9W6JPG7_9HYPH|nr:phosphotransferase [Methylopila turkensis]GLK81360.1 choline kinase [Methylopila turkensis]
MDAEARIRALAIWRGPVEPVRLDGGITNHNFLVEDDGRRYVARIGEDIPVHGVMRFNERAASVAAHAAGVSPAVRHAADGVLVIDHVAGRTLTSEDVRAELPRVVELVKRTHRETQRHLRGPALAFWPFHVLRDYIHGLREGGHRFAQDLPRFSAIAERLEAAVGPTEMVFAHNDLLPGNFLDDGARLWLIDWDYAGFNSPLFDLGNLASNNELSPGERETLLTLYYDRPPDDALRLRFQAMLTASLLRETLWSMASELSSTIDFDYRAYTAENLLRFERAYRAFTDMDDA